MTASRTPIPPLAFEHLILASFRKIKTSLAAASSPAAPPILPSGLAIKLISSRSRAISSDCFSFGLF
jgi:hypothetical protein